MNDIMIVYVSDWEALYVNKACVLQNHSIRICDLEKYVPIESIQQLEANDKLYEYAEENGDLPWDFDELIQLCPMFKKKGNEE